MESLVTKKLDAKGTKLKEWTTDNKLPVGSSKASVFKCNESPISKHK